MQEKVAPSADTGSGNDAKPPLARTLIKAILKDAVLFHDQFNDGYLAPKGDGTEILRLRSRQFRFWLYYHVNRVLGRSLSPNLAAEITHNLEGQAAHEGARYPLAVRVTRHQRAFWYDLGRQAVRITKDGWDVIDRPPILFISRSNRGDPPVASPRRLPG